MSDAVARISSTTVSERRRQMFNNNNNSNRRGLQTEEECAAAEAELYSENDDVAGATFAYLANFLVSLGSIDFNTDCTKPADLYLTCQLGDTVIDGEDELSAACTAAGGTVATSEGDLECELGIEGSIRTVQYDFPVVISCQPTMLNGTAIDCSSFIPPLISSDDLVDLENALTSGGATSASCRTGTLSTPPPSGSYDRLAGGFAMLLGSTLLYMLA
jgi:hypothetical protein